MRSGQVRSSSPGENEFAGRFPGCEIGAMPPFGNLYDMAVYVDRTLAEDEKIAFNAGSHSELIQLPYKDFERLVKPKILDFAAHRPDELARIFHPAVLEGLWTISDLTEINTALQGPLVDLAAAAQRRRYHDA